MLRSNPSASRPAAEHRSSADISDYIVSAMDAIVRKLAEKPKAVREAFRSFARDANADKQGQGFLAMVEQGPTPQQHLTRRLGRN